jgi:hypothetical protein
MLCITTLYHNAECNVSFVVMLSVIVLSVIMPNVVMLNVVAPIFSSKTGADLSGAPYGISFYCGAPGLISLA